MHRHYLVRGNVRVWWESQHAHDLADLIQLAALRLAEVLPRMSEKQMWAHTSVCRFLPSTHVNGPHIQIRPRKPLAQEVLVTGLQAHYPYALVTTLAGLALSSSPTHPHTCPMCKHRLCLLGHTQTGTVSFLPVAARHWSVLFFWLFRNHHTHHWSRTTHVLTAPQCTLLSPVPVTSSPVANPHALRNKKCTRDKVDRLGGGAGRKEAKKEPTVFKGAREVQGTSRESMAGHSPAKQGERVT